ncbi:MAG: 23S rRNA (guanosine(2251)-2'-O)-methyltransferase RlmB [Anaerolineales bacterium]|nr:23S rRNA (guanosine(2251)-2'-O)-methyltransferase RlmB [Anaerolineales bacterium]MCK5634087.1 23S rRNA (guanosine(2251)-2'-O)-methyltransferase RlmB [Anaerolineales bacterium]
MGGNRKETVYGRNPVREVLRAGRRRIHQIRLAEGVLERGLLVEIGDLARARGTGIKRVPRTLLDREISNHQGIVAVVDPFEYGSIEGMLELAEEREEPPWILLLDMIQDPQNLGTLLRTAEAVGVHGVVIPARRSASVTPAVVSASSGASEHMIIARGNMADAIERLKKADLWVAGLENTPEASIYWDADLKGPLGLVVGSEGSGMRRRVRESCDFLVSIPMRGKIESLNASVAGAIGLYAILERRGFDVSNAQ